MPDRAQPTVARTIAVAAPAAVAIAVFGVLYGAAARPLMGPVLTMISSVVIFSGATQFTSIGLLAAGAAGPAILATVALLNVRHLLMGAVLRSSLGPSRFKRAFLAWFLLDESFGFTMLAADRTPPGPQRVAVRHDAHGNRHRDRRISVVQQAERLAIAGPESFRQELVAGCVQ